MFLPILFGLFLFFSVWVALHEMVTMRRWWPKETGHFLLIGSGLLVLCVISGAI